MSAPRKEQSTQLRNPAMELVSDQNHKIYVAALEKQVMMMARRDVQLRSALECATGRAYDSFDPREMSFDDIAEVIAHDLSRGLNLSIDEARSRVQENIQTANP